jgi:hypothetical protein
MTHPYKDYEDTPIWRAVDRAISDLERNSDVALVTTREHVVGFITKAVSASALGALSQDEYRGVLNVMNEACNGANAIEDWECHSLTGLTKDELKAVLNKLNGDTTEPEH